MLLGYPVINQFQFTFHYVSIKSTSISLLTHIFIWFTFHYVSIKSNNFPFLRTLYSDLHSTMYLLNQLISPSIIALIMEFTFHYVSIKSLTWSRWKTVMPIFTFHYVSIKSSIAHNLVQYQLLFTFHYVSIKSKDIGIGTWNGRLFTFHYVSIKSCALSRNIYEHLHLHSTMYLLNLNELFALICSSLFTFHYVSIKSAKKRLGGYLAYWFTFHYVSIKSNNIYIHHARFKHLHSTMYLLNLPSLQPFQARHQIYIPLCIY